MALTEMKGSEDVMTSTRLCNKNTLQNTSNIMLVDALLVVISFKNASKTRQMQNEKNSSWAYNVLLGLNQSSGFAFRSTWSMN